MAIALRIPVACIAAQTIRQLLPHERRVRTGGGPRWIQQRRRRAPQPPRRAGSANLAAAFTHRRGKRFGQALGASEAKLGLRRTREERRDVMSEAAQPQVDLAQAVEEKQPGAHHWMFELSLHELERRELAR